MEGNKSALASKTVWAGIALLVFNVLVPLKVLPEALDEQTFVNAVNGILAVLAIVFRWNATDTIGNTPNK